MVRGSTVVGLGWYGRPSCNREAGRLGLSKQFISRRERACSNNCKWRCESVVHSCHILKINLLTGFADMAGTWTNWYLPLSFTNAVYVSLLSPLLMVRARCVFVCPALPWIFPHSFVLGSRTERIHHDFLRVATVSDRNVQQSAPSKEQPISGSSLR